MSRGLNMDYIKESLEKLHFNNITPIQEEFFKKFKENKNLVGVAKTGTGKTHAYLIPVLGSLNLALEEVQAVIVVPTNELVFQVTNMLLELDDRFSVSSFFGGIDKKKEITKLRRKQPQIVVTIPNKLVEFSVKEGLLKIHTSKYLILDEADMMFDEGFMNEIDLFINHFMNSRFIMMSATVKENMLSFIKKYFGQFELIDVTKQNDLNIKYSLINIKNKDRLSCLRVLIDLMNPFLCLVFVSKKDDIKTVYETIREKNNDTTYYSSDINIRQRKKILDDIVIGKYQYVVVSDLASRGIDFKASTVINYDLPNNMEYFFHRCGRTGRMNSDGEVYILSAPTDSRKVDKIKDAKIKLVEYSVVGTQLKEETRKQKVDDELIGEIKKIKKPSKVTPNYEKKNKAKIDKVKKNLRKARYAKNR